MNALPQWMAEKIRKLANSRALRENTGLSNALDVLSGEAFQELENELARFPELSRILSNSLSRNICTGALSALTALELAAIIITDNDAQMASIIASPEDLVEFTTLKICALSNLLGEEGGMR